jgi:phenylalanyl-tRNA synthetase alpha chain
MLDRIHAIEKEIENLSASSIEEVESHRISYISKKGSISQLFTDFKNVPNDQKKEVGKLLNELKDFALEKINSLRDSFLLKESEESGSDLTMPGEFLKLGTRHPLSLVRNEIIQIFGRLGFIVAEGPEIEDDWHVFSALNFPPEHPARDMQDTFFIEKNPDVLLRTHTSSVQIRIMEKTQPPSGRFSPEGYFAMKPFLQGHIAYSIR